MNYTATIREGISKEGVAAFFTVPKWFSRVLMNAPAQGTLPWFYNEILPLGEEPVLRLLRRAMISFEEDYEPVYDPRIATHRVSSLTAREPLTLQRTLTSSTSFGATSSSSSR